MSDETPAAILYTSGTSAQPKGVRHSHNSLRWEVVATTTIAAYVSLGGLGRYVIDGYAQLDYSQMLAGALLVALLAIIIDLVLVGVQRLVVSPGLVQTGVSRRRAWFRRARNSAVPATAAQAVNTRGNI